MSDSIVKYKARLDAQSTPIRPDYYKGKVECIDAIAAAMTPAEFIAFCKGQVIKYIWRFEHKNGLEDLQKAEWYLGRLIKEYAKEEVKNER